jgi:glycosyltransferase involved in cell wall biosynthesis
LGDRDGRLLARIAHGIVRARMNVLVSVVVAAYNEEKHVRECIDSLLRQTYRPLEILVGDDGSVDRTAEIVQDLAGVRLFRFPHRGKGSTVNATVENASGEILVFADADLVYDERYVEELGGPILRHECEGTCHATETVGNPDNRWARCFLTATVELEKPKVVVEIGTDKGTVGAGDVACPPAWRPPRHVRRRAVAGSTGYMSRGRRLRRRTARASSRRPWKGGRCGRAPRRSWRKPTSFSSMPPRTGNSSSDCSARSRRLASMVPPLVVFDDHPTVEHACHLASRDSAKARLDVVRSFLGHGVSSIGCRVSRALAQL